jgi:hypothetical protein
MDFSRNNRNERLFLESRSTLFQKEVFYIFNALNGHECCVKGQENKKYV